MDAALLWTAVGSVAGVIGAGLVGWQLRLQLLEKRKATRSYAAAKETSRTEANDLQLATDLGQASAEIHERHEVSAAELHGWLIGDLPDPFDLEVHRPIEIAVRPGGAELEILPEYVERKHDTRLAEVVARTVGGRSAIAVLVGGSSTGKTRACWEAIQRLPPGWRLWHPIFPDRAEAFLAGLERVGPRTVVWLNEAQHYLLTSDPKVGDRVAAGLRDLLRDSRRAPILILGTIWPQYWDPLTTPPSVGGAHAHATALLEGAGIEVPDAFTAHDMTVLVSAAQCDPRLAEAAKKAEEGQVTQFLAGVPALLERYRTAPPAARAVIHAAMDARRHGCGPALPRALLEAAAHAYLTRQQQEQLGEDWLMQALDYTAKPCNGVRGPVTPIISGPLEQSEPAAFRHFYLLADYLEQVGRHDRAGHPSPSVFWDAAAAYAHPADLTALATHAADGGLFRYAAILGKRGVTAGRSKAAIPLIELLAAIDSGNLPEAKKWVAAHVDLSDPWDITFLLYKFREAGSEDALEALLNRDPAAHIDLDNPLAVGSLVETLYDVGAEAAIPTLLGRDPAACTDLSDTDAAIHLLYMMWDARADDAVAALATRIATHADITDPECVKDLLDALRWLGATEALAKLLARDPAAHADLTDPVDVVLLLERLREVGAEEGVAVLEARVARDADVSDPGSGGFLLDKLRAAGSMDAVAILADRAAAHVDLTRPGIAALLLSLYAAGANGALASLAARVSSAADVSNPATVSGLTNALREAGAVDAAATLANRAVAQVAPDATRHLLDAVHGMGTKEAAEALLARDPVAHADLSDPGATARLLSLLHGAGVEDAVAALLARDPVTHADLTHPYSIVMLLDALRSMGAADAARALTARIATHADLSDPYAAPVLLSSLYAAGFADATVALSGRAAAHANLSKPYTTVLLLSVLRAAGAKDAVVALLVRDPAAQADLSDPYATAFLLDALHNAGATELVAKLIARTVVDDDPDPAVSLLCAIRLAGAADAVVALLADDSSAHTDLCTPHADTFLLHALHDRSILRGRGTKRVVDALKARAADADPGASKRLLRALRSSGGYLSWDPAQIASQDPDADEPLLNALHAAGAEAAVNALTDRAADRGFFRLIRPADRARRFPYGREPDGKAAFPWGWRDLS